MNTLVCVVLIGAVGTVALADNPYHAPAPYHPAPYHPTPAPYHPAPSYHKPEPVYHKPEPVYHKPEPVYHKPEPSYHKPAPSYHGHGHDPYKLPPRPFSYEYGVKDEYSGAYFDKKETQDEYGVVAGEYRVALPDGRTQIVTYHADHENGYVADVRYEGEPKYEPYHPKEPAPYHPAPKPAPYHPAPKPAPYHPTPAPYHPTPAPYHPTSAPYHPSPAPVYHPAPAPYHPPSYHL